LSLAKKDRKAPPPSGAAGSWGKNNDRFCLQGADGKSFFELSSHDAEFKGFSGKKMRFVLRRAGQAARLPGGRGPYCTLAIMFAQ
jgi:hypothetical protein